MKNILKIYKSDIKRICTNWVARIMIIVLIIIPSLYSLINIKAAWDPYSNTVGIKIAVINDDKGTTFKGKDINLGDELVNKLKENDKLGWIFTDKENAQKDLLLEKYYATIEIPEDFSENVTTLVEKDIKKPKLIYTVNEKKNAVAPKMTDSGINTVKTELDQNIIKTVSGVLFKVFNERSIDIEGNRPKLRKMADNIYELDDSMSGIETILDDAGDGTVQISGLLTKANDMLPALSNTLDSTAELLNNSQTVLDEAQGELSDISPIIKEDLIKSEDILDTSSVELKNLDKNILPEVAKKSLLTLSDSSKATKETVSATRRKLKNIKKFIDKLSKIEINAPAIDNSIQTTEGIEEINDKLNKQVETLKDMQKNLKEISKIISDTTDRLDSIEDKLQIMISKSGEEIKKLDNGEGVDTDSLKALIEVVDEVHALVADTTDKYDSEIVPAAQDGFDSIRDILGNSLEIIDEGQKVLPEVENLLSVSQNASDLSQNELNNLKNKLPEAKDKIHELADKLRKVDEDDRIDELLDMITNDWDNQSNFVASPVEIEDNRLFPWANYGSATTPFYTVLCLWVGGLLCSVLLSLEAPGFEDDIKIKPYEVYLGKLLTFLSIGVCQAITASLGALCILRVSAIHPIMFVFYSIFVIIVFTTVIYTAGSMLDDVGKAIIVVILVLQMAGASGNFPIEVTPILFQKVFPFLPFTYAISGMRQIMAGIVYSILIKDMVVLCIWMISAIILGISLKGLFNKLTGWFMSQLSASGILRH
jgi:putative membrane protein